MRLTFRPIGHQPLRFDVEKDSILVGRGSSCDVVLQVEGISRQHCKIEVDSSGAIFLTDLGSTNGVLINNERLSPNHKTPYAPYLALVIGGVPTMIETDMSGIESLGTYRAVKKESTRMDTEVTVQLQPIPPQVASKAKAASRLNRVQSVAQANPPRTNRVLILLLGALLLAGITYFFLQP
jgi:predicted component of type VI protein secretion system